ncbi:hypothetical protein IWW51_003195 [Coemansia sp. RSA 2702]|nr:hypothetical protein IWW51_003195 [Coemansia sp. RSA 2702]
MQSKLGGQIDASISTIIKTVLAQTGPQTRHQLFARVNKMFPQEFKNMSRHKFKSVYITNLKEFKQIREKPTRDPEVIEELAKDPDSRVKSGQTDVWVISMEDAAATKYTSGSVDLATSHNKIQKAIDRERTKSRDFWEGKSNTPHDWKAILESSGQKTSL